MSFKSVGLKMRLSHRWQYLFLKNIDSAYARIFESGKFVHTEIYDFAVTPVHIYCIIFWWLGNIFVHQR